MSYHLYHHHHHHQICRQTSKINLCFYYIGKGTTNDGNTARRFFKNAELTSAITNVDLQLIKRFGVILKTMSRSYDINLEKFEDYTLETAEFMFRCTPVPEVLYRPAASVHKILIHGTDVIRSALLPIG